MDNGNDGAVNRGGSQVHGSGVVVINRNTGVGQGLTPGVSLGGSGNGLAVYNQLVVNRLFCVRGGLSGQTECCVGQRGLVGVSVDTVVHLYSSECATGDSQGQSHGHTARAVHHVTGAYLGKESTNC